MTIKVIIIALALSGLILSQLSQVASIHTLNLAVSHALQTWQPAWLIIISKIISAFEYCSIPISLIISTYLFQKGRKTEATFIFLAGFSWLVQTVLKVILRIPCPTAQEVLSIAPFHGLINLTTVCYPSGHVFDYIGLWGMLYYFRLIIWKNQLLQKLMNCLALSAILTVGLARISLGAHFLTDVIGGYLLGSAWLLLLISLYEHNLQRRKVVTLSPTYQ
jgi:undecaprenyl-diphosphatase